MLWKRSRAGVPLGFMAKKGAARHVVIVSNRHKPGIVFSIPMS